jgi:hypothetical protein
MSTQKRKSKKKLDGGSRKHDAKRWLSSKDGPHRNYVASYMKRYGVDEVVATEELYTLGYYENVYEEELNENGIRSEYIMNPLTGELVLVPEGTQEHELFI